MAAPGWYPDPEDATLVRWWNGRRWTDDRQAQPPRERARPAGGVPPAVQRQKTPPEEPRSALLSGLLSVRGRASRSEFWTVFAVLIAFFVAIGITDEVMLASGTPAETADAVIGLLLICWLLTFAAFITTLVRRLHDVGRSGWNALLAIVPFGGLLLLYWAMKAGEPLLNAYGGPPR